MKFRSDLEAIKKGKETRNPTEARIWNENEEGEKEIKERKEKTRNRREGKKGEDKK